MSGIFQNANETGIKTQGLADYNEQVNHSRPLDQIKFTLLLLSLHNEYCIPNEKEDSPTACNN